MPSLSIIKNVNNRSKSINFVVRVVEINKCPNIAPDFGSDSRHIKWRISGYVTLDATQKPDQKTSKMG